MSPEQFKVLKAHLATIIFLLAVIAGAVIWP